jgi:hypothetical protein
MNRLLTNFFIALVFYSAPAGAEDTYVGTFIHYEDAEYESTFVPCGTIEVWKVLDSADQRLLIERAMTIERREIVVALILDVTPIDKDKYPQSHYTGVAKVISIIAAEENQTSCERQ